MNEKVKVVLARMEAMKHGRGGEYWNVPRTTAEFLGLMVRACGARKVLEIGTSNGYSGLFLAEALSHGGGLLYTVESNRGRFEAAAENFKKAGLGSYVRQVLGHAPEVFGRMTEDLSRKPGAEGGVGSGGSSVGPADMPEAGVLAGERDFDLVFIDATKNEYLSYFEAVLPKVRPGGLIIADNCVSHRRELGEFFGFVGMRRDLESVLLPFDNGLLIIIKN